MKQRNPSEDLTDSEVNYDSNHTEDVRVEIRRLEFWIYFKVDLIGFTDGFNAQ